MKGGRKKHKFKKGHTLSPKRVGLGPVSDEPEPSTWLPRQSYDDFKVLTRPSYDGKSYVLSTYETPNVNVNLLRPKHPDGI